MNKPYFQIDTYTRSSDRGLVLLPANDGTTGVHDMQSGLRIGRLEREDSRKETDGGASFVWTLACVMFGLGVLFGVAAAKAGGW